MNPWSFLLNYVFEWSLTLKKSCNKDWNLVENFLYAWLKHKILTLIQTMLVDLPVKKDLRLKNLLRAYLFCQFSNKFKKSVLS